MIKIIKENPSFIDEILSAGLKPEKTTIFPYGLTIFNPSGKDIPDDILIHEAIHIRQQGDDPKYWWKRYLADSEFRLSQELEANREQYKFFCKVKKDRNERARALLAIAKNMAGEVYNLDIKVDKLMALIKE